MGCEVREGAGKLGGQTWEDLKGKVLGSFLGRGSQIGYYMG